MTSTAPLQGSGSPNLSPDASHAGSTTQEHAEGHGDFRLFGLATFLVADGMTFAGFFAAYLTFRAVNPLQEGSTYELELLLPTINTVVLIISSFTFHRAGKECRGGNLGASRLWLAITGALGAIFLAGQMVEYFSLPWAESMHLTDAGRQPPWLPGRATAHRKCWKARPCWIGPGP